jgi:hypothetical protein
MTKTSEQNQLEFEMMQTKAMQNGFIVKKFTGFVVCESESDCEMYFETLEAAGVYIEFCRLFEGGLL